MRRTPSPESENNGNIVEQINNILPAESITLSANSILAIRRLPFLEKEKCKSHMNIMLSHLRASVVETKGDAVTTASWNKGKCQKVSIRA